MNNRNLFLFTLVMLLSLSLGSSYYFYSSDEDTNNQASSVFSVKEAARSISFKKDYIDTKLLFASQIESEKKISHREDQKSSLLKKLYYKNFLMAPSRIANYIELLEKEHEILIHNLDIEGVEIDRLTSLKPRFNIALTYFLGIKLGDLSNEDLETIKLTNKQWYIIKTFSESKDFLIMLKRDALTPEFVQIDNLTKYYANINHTK